MRRLRQWFARWRDARSIRREIARQRRELERPAPTALLAALAATNESPMAALLATGARMAALEQALRRIERAACDLLDNGGSLEAAERFEAARAEARALLEDRPTTRSKS